MIQISRAIGEQTVQSYYRERYTMGDYYSQEATLRGHWYGIEAEALGLVGETQPRDFDRIMAGRLPDAKFEADQLGKWEQSGGGKFILRDQESQQIQAEVQRVGRNDWRHSLAPEKHFKFAGGAQHAAERALTGTMVHYREKDKSRRAWDIVSRPGKTVSVAAVVGGDKRIIEAHRRSNTAMLRVMEQLVQARGGGNNQNTTAGRFIVARFEHYTARPEDVKSATGETVLYPAALLHTHNVMANWTRTPEGQIRSIDPHEMFKFQAIGKAVYQAHMARELREMGYTVEYGKNGAPEIAGYSKEYLESESARSIKIQKELEAQGFDGARAADILAKSGRNEKLGLTAEEVAAMHRANDAAHGHQNERIIGESLERAKTYEFLPEISAEEAVTQAKRSLAERFSVFEHWELIVKALEYGQGHVLEDEVIRNIASRTQTQGQMEKGIRAEFMPVDHVREFAPGIRYTTDIQHTHETDLCEMMATGRNTVEPLARGITAEEIAAQIRCLAPPKSEREIEQVRTAIQDAANSLVERIAVPLGSENDPYWEHWYEDHGRPMDNPSPAMLKSPQRFDYIDAINEKFEAWREAEVANDISRLGKLEKRLEQLDSVDFEIVRKRLQIKADVALRFEALTGGIKPNNDQLSAAHAILTSPDRISGIVGAAGAGKTTVLQTIQAVAQEQGYRVVGVAPTAKAVEKMKANGIKSTTLQAFLIANTPEAIAHSRKTIGKYETKLTKLGERIVAATESLAKAEQSLNRARQALTAAKAQFILVEAKANNRYPVRSLRAAIERDRRREQYRAQLGPIAARIQKQVGWCEASRERIVMLKDRIQNLQGQAVETKQTLVQYRQTVYDRGVSLDGTPRLIFSDESSLASNRQCAELFRMMKGQDRVALVGDPGQHESIEASRAFDLLLQAGMRRGEIYEIVRQNNKQIKAVVEKCHVGKHHRALDMLKAQGRIEQIPKRADRLESLVSEFMKSPDNSLVIVPDNRTRLEINTLIREQWKETGRLHGEAIKATVLVPKQDLTVVDREIAKEFDVGVVIRCREEGKGYDMKRGSYWTVASRDTDKNTVSAYQTAADGTIQKRTFNPADFKGTLEVFDKQEREFMVGDRVLFKRPWAEHSIVNGSAALVHAIDKDKQELTVRLVRDNSLVSWPLPAGGLSRMPHIEHGYVTTSYSVQGDTSTNTYAHFDTADKGAKNLISRAMLYVAFSRPKEELRIWTNDFEKLRSMMLVSNEKAMALSPGERYQYLPEEYEKQKQQQHNQKKGMSISA